MILLISISGMAIIAFRKIPVLVDLPLTSSEEGLFLKTKRKIKGLDFSEIFNSKNFLQKFLMRIRILTLKMENKISKTLYGLRQKDNEGHYKKDNYWEEIKEFNSKKNQKNKKNKKV
ncbi:MAG: hypothetical protein WBC21_00795 [Minisyncoccales bacterium]